MTSKKKEIVRSHSIKADEKQYYQDNGYLLLEDIISIERCDQLIAEAERVAAGEYRSYLTMHQESSLFLETLRDPILLSILDSVQESRMIPIGSLFLFCKRSDHGRALSGEEFEPNLIETGLFAERIHQAHGLVQRRNVERDDHLGHVSLALRRR